MNKNKCKMIINVKVKIAPKITVIQFFALFFEGGWINCCQELEYLTDFVND